MSAEMVIVIGLVIGVAAALVLTFRKKGGDSDLSPYMDDDFDLD